MPLEFFGLSIGRTDKEANDNKNMNKAIVPPVPPEGSIPVESFNGMPVIFGQFVNVEYTLKNEADLISRYRSLALQPEIDIALTDIINEMMVCDDSGAPVSLQFENLPESFKSIESEIQKSYEKCMALLDFNNRCSDIARKWYIEGKLYYQHFIDKEHPTDGLKEIRNLDAKSIRKVIEYKKEIDNNLGREIVVGYDEYYLFTPQALYSNNPNVSQTVTANADAANGVKILPDTISYVHSGLVDAATNMSLSYLHKAIRPMNQLRMVEDSLVIYRLARAPERKAFYVDVGNMPATKTEEYMNKLINKYRNKVVYDATTGEITDDRKQMEKELESNRFLVVRI